MKCTAVIQTRLTFCLAGATAQLDSCLTSQKKQICHLFAHRPSLMFLFHLSCFFASEMQSLDHVLPYSFGCLWEGRSQSNRPSKNLWVAGPRQDVWELDGGFNSFVSTISFALSHKTFTERLVTLLHIVITIILRMDSSIQIFVETHRFVWCMIAIPTYVDPPILCITIPPSCLSACHACTADCDAYQSSVL